MKCPPVLFPKQFCKDVRKSTPWPKKLLPSILQNSTFHQLESVGQSLQAQNSGYDPCWGSPAQSRLLSTPDSLFCSHCLVPPKDRDSNSPGMICTGSTLHVAHMHGKSGGGIPLLWSLYNCPRGGPTWFPSLPSLQASRNLSFPNAMKKGDSCALFGEFALHTEFKSPKCMILNVFSKLLRQPHNT